MSLSEHQHFDRIFIQFSAILQNRFDKLQLNTFPYHRIPPLFSGIMQPPACNLQNLM